MRERIVVLAALAIALFEPTLVAAGPWLGEWASEVTLDANGTLLSGAESSLDLGYATGPILWTSRSEFRLGVGYLWQEFGVRGVVGRFDVECDALFGPSTTDFLYAQAVAGLRIGGLDVGLFCAVLSDAVLGGPAGGVAVRVGGTFGGLEVVSITELGARIEDEEFDGIDIVHGATGLHRHYATDPVVAGRGVTGEKVSVSEAGFGRAPDVRGVAYFTSGGLGFVAAQLGDVDPGVDWLRGDLEVSYDVARKHADLTLRAGVGDGLLSLEPCFGIDFGAADLALEGARLGGLTALCAWGGVTVRSLAVFDSGRYVIATEECGSIIESVEDAVENGDEYYSRYGQLLSVAVVWDGRGGANRIRTDTYFDKDSRSVFGWGMSYVEALVALSPGTDLSADFTATPAGLDDVGIELTLRW